MKPADAREKPLEVQREDPLLVTNRKVVEDGGRQDFVLKRPAVHIQSPNLRLTNHDFGFTARLLGVRLLPTFGWTTRARKVEEGEHKIKALPGFTFGGHL